MGAAAEEDKGRREELAAAKRCAHSLPACTFATAGQRKIKCLAEPWSLPAIPLHSLDVLPPSEPCVGSILHSINCLLVLLQGGKRGLAKAA